MLMPRRWPSSRHRMHSALLGKACPMARKRLLQHFHPNTAESPGEAHNPESDAAPARHGGQCTNRWWPAKQPRESRRDTRSYTSPGSGSRCRTRPSAAGLCRGSRTSSSGRHPAAWAARARARTSSPASGRRTDRTSLRPALARPPPCRSRPALRNGRSNENSSTDVAQQTAGN